MRKITVYKNGTPNIKGTRYAIILAGRLKQRNLHGEEAIDYCFSYLATRASGFTVGIITGAAMDIAEGKS